MNYYAFHLGDYASATGHLSWDEDMAYRRLIDAYYQRESPLPNDIRQVYRLTRAQTDCQRLAIDTVLNEFFSLTDEGWRHYRCDAEIEAVSGKRQKASQSAKARWSKASAMQSQSEGNANACEEECVRIETECVGNAPNPNPNPNPSVLKDTEAPNKPAKAPRKTRIPDPFMLTLEMRSWAADATPAVDVKAETENFVDYWRGEAKTKADWPATWRNWMRRAQKDSGTRRGPVGGYVNRQQQIEDENARVVAEIGRQMRQDEAKPQDDVIGTGDVIIEGEVIYAQ